MERILFSLIKLGIGTIAPDDSAAKELLELSMKQWKAVMALAEKQGMAAIVFDGVQRLYDTYGKEISAAKNQYAEWMQWVFTCTGMMSQYEQRCLAQRKVIAQLADIWAKEGIHMMVFKGQANASLYPNPTHRATGDIDCFLFGEANRGDDILKEHGALIDNRWYRHSKIQYKGETIENHRVMGHTRGSKKKRKMEEELVCLALERVESGELRVESQLEVESGEFSVESQLKGESLGCALMPSAQFNACFLTYHGLHHFLSEGLRMKQILDWAMLLKTEQDKVDWPAFHDFCKRYQLDKFAAVMNYIAKRYLNVNDNVDDNHNVNVGELAERVLQSTLYDDDYLFNSGKSNWQVRWQLVKNMLIRDRWKYRDIAQQSAWRHLWEQAKGFLLKEES